MSLTSSVWTRLLAHSDSCGVGVSRGPQTAKNAPLSTPRPSTRHCANQPRTLVSRVPCGAIAMAEPSKQNKGVREPGTRVFKVASSLGEPELDPTGASFRHSIESLLNLPRAVENADNFNALRQYFVKDENLLEPRN